MKVLITDLDNTLYDWVTFFSKAFKAMVIELEKIIHVDQEQLLDEFKVIHEKYGNTEHPFAILELPSVTGHFGNLPARQLIKKLAPALQAFKSVRKNHLYLYQTVWETLAALKSEGVKIVGFTDAIAINGYYRLNYLGLLRFFDRLYASDNNAKEHPNPESAKRLTPPKNFIRPITKESRKPNPLILHKICKEEGLHPDLTWYIGDSLVKDIAMAKQAGVKAIWAKYGARYDKSLWNVLVRVTHWTQDDLKRENQLREDSKSIIPDYVVDSFVEVRNIINQTADKKVHPVAGAA